MVNQSKSRDLTLSQVNQHSKLIILVPNVSQVFMDIHHGTFTALFSSATTPQMTTIQTLIVEVPLPIQVLHPVVNHLMLGLKLEMTEVHLNKAVKTMMITKNKLSNKFQGIQKIITILQ